MNIKSTHILLLTILFFGGCSDTITNHYQTRAQAETDNLLERGWLPSHIPTSAKDITTSNNLDINISEAEFRYDPKETNEFLKHLTSYSAQEPKMDRWKVFITKQKMEGYNAFEYTAEETGWVFLVNAGTGHVRYVMWLQ
jgi:hypothetical protein